MRRQILETAFFFFFFLTPLLFYRLQLDAFRFMIFISGFLVNFLLSVTMYTKCNRELQIIRNIQYQWVRLYKFGQQVIWLKINGIQYIIKKSQYFLLSVIQGWVARGASSFASSSKICPLGKILALMWYSEFTPSKNFIRQNCPFKNLICTPSPIKTLWLHRYSNLNI